MSNLTIFSYRQAHTSLGDRSVEGPPGPIPNPEVKLDSADGTWRETARESRSLPRDLLPSPPPRVTEKTPNLWLGVFCLTRLVFLHRRLGLHGFAPVLRPRLRERQMRFYRTPRGQRYTPALVG